MITVILNTYNRPHVLNEQINAIKNQSIVPTQILVWMNKGDVEYPKINDPSVIVNTCTHNLKFHARFALGLLAKTEYVAFFDDDTIPGKKWFENCLSSIKKQPGIYGTTGIKLTGTKYDNHIKIGWNGEKSNSIEKVHLVGHAWFLKTEWLKYMWYERPQSWENGEDIQLSYFCQKYGNINTFVPPHPVSDRSMWGSIDGIKYGTDKNATYLKHKNEHFQIRNSLCERFLKEGWK